ncbi:MAG: hypothetical protein K2W85_03490 [Phycisphaerales bacterium]|nr:hypothetical protein [Phycisphaerales bacterium]
MPKPRGQRSSERSDGPDAGERKPPPLGDLARHAVCRVLARQARHYPEFDLYALERTLENEPALSELDRAFAHAVYDAAVRHWLALEFLLARCVDRPIADLEPKLRGVLMACAAQIIVLDRVPTHAAINHAVEWAKKVIRPGAGAMANAVLRKLTQYHIEDSALARRPRFTDQRDELPLHDGGSIVLAQAILPEDELERLSIYTSHPVELLKHWMRSASMRDVRQLAMHGLCHAPTVLNTTHSRGPLPEDRLSPHSAPGHHVFSGSASQLRTLLNERPDIWVQDAASALAIQSVSDLRPSLVLDLCAGQGTKTRQLAATFPKAQIIATDVDDGRFDTLSAGFAGSEQVRVVRPKQIREKFLGKADLILLDVPCSNTGVLARRPEARYRFSAETLKSLVGVQKQIIADALPMLRDFGSPKGGKVLYSTCSLEAEENAQQTAWADKWHKLGVSRVHRRAPSRQPGDSASIYSDGSFAGLLG